MVQAVTTVLVGILCLYGGLPALYLALTNPAPTTMTCTEAEPQVDGARWLSLSECKVGWSEAVYVTVGKTVTEVYLPVRGEERGAVKLILASRRPADLALGEGLMAAHGAQEGMEQALEAHRELQGRRTQLDGLIRPWSALMAPERAALSRLNLPEERALYVLDDGASPDLTTGGVLTLVSALCFAAAAARLRARKRLSA